MKVIVGYLMWHLCCISSYVINSLLDVILVYCTMNVAFPNGIIAINVAHLSGTYLQEYDS
jgi:hypothetical protein